MSLGFFLIGGMIFAVYMYFTLWNIFYSSKKQREENYPTHEVRTHMGNYGKFPNSSKK